MVGLTMGAKAKPNVLFFDLDDTIVSFSTGQDDLWLRMLQQHGRLLSSLTQSGVTARGAEGSSAVSQPCHSVGLARVINDVVTPVYWKDPVRAARGRLDLFRSRREVLLWAACCYFEGADVAEVERRWEQNAFDMNSARFGESLLQIADAYTDAKEDAVAPLEDAIDVLHTLRDAGFRLALLTNGGSRFQRRKLARFGLEPLFEAIVIEGEWGVGKPHVSVFERALEMTGADAQRVWMIGDNYEADILGAAQVGIGGVWLHHGRPDPGGAVNPLHTIAHIRELIALLT